MESMREHPSDAGRRHGVVVLRDRLAAQRTIMANERSFLAVIRTALSLLGVGAMVIKIFGEVFWTLLGLFLIGSGTVVFALGLKNYLHRRRLIAEESELEPGHEGWL